MVSFGDRIIVLIDMDCFFCQVEAKLQPNFKGKPLAVVQYNQWKEGDSTRGIIAVNYEARAFGITRGMRGDQAQEKCPDLILACVPALRGKADTTRYRNAGREVIEVLKKHCSKIERASVDEAYLDITELVENRIAKVSMSPHHLYEKLPNTYVAGYSDSEKNNEEQRKTGLETWLTSSSDELDDIQAQKLAVAGIIIEEIRADIYGTTEFRCSAGISYNKILAKLACGLHKPNKQTILPTSGVANLFKALPVKKVRNLGGKLGDIVTDSLKCNVMSDLLQYSLHDLQKYFDEKTAFWLYNIARGVDNEPVTTRLVSKSIGACKNFPSKQAIVNKDVLMHWLKDLSEEICERLEQDFEENQRRATLLTISFHYYKEKIMISQSRSCSLNSYKFEKIADLSFNIVSKCCSQYPIAFLGLSAGKFVPARESGRFRNYFTANMSKEGNNINLFTPAEIVYPKLHSILRSNQENDIKSLEKTVETSEDLEIKKGNLLDNYKFSPGNNLDKTLKSENFKQSFFANILKDVHESIKENPNGERLDCKANEEVRNLYSSGSEDIFLSESNKSESEDNKHLINTEELTTTSKHLTAPRVSSSNWSAAKMDNVEPFVNNKENFTVKLHELFPELSNIDPGVISLLPLALQKEASELLKNTTKINKKATLLANHSKLKKNNKMRSLDSGSSKGDNCIHNFLIKAVPSSEIDDTLKKCDKCYQLVAVEKIIEHNDYHLAQELQKEINKSTDIDNQLKRKQNFDSTVEGPKRKNTKNGKKVTSIRSISSFFS